MPSDASADKTETIQHPFALHWIAYVEVLFVYALSIAGFTYHLLVGVLFLATAIVSHYRYWMLEMGMTETRVVLRRGIFSRTTHARAYAYIKAVEVQQTPFSRNLDYGDLKLIDKDDGHLILRLVRNPLAAKQAIEQRLAK